MSDAAGRGPGRGGGRGPAPGRGRGRGAAEDGNKSGWKRCKACGGRGHTVGDCPQVKECSHCNSTEHRAKQCTFGAKSTERFLLCKNEGPRLPCFWRRFLVPLRRGDAVTFDPKDPKIGRVDVGVRCTSACLCRSQGLRRNSQLCLAFEASGHTLETSGALVRDLRPDEATIGTRIRSGLDQLLKEGAGPPDPETDPEGFSASLLRGFEAEERSAEEALKSMLKAARKAAKHEEEPRRVAVLLLVEDGTPIGKACSELKDQPLAGAIVVLGDDRGLTSEESTRYTELAEAQGAGMVLRVSLGGTTLLASHAIVIVQHYLDERLHTCEVPKPRDYGYGKQEGKDPKRQKTS